MIMSMARRCRMSRLILFNKPFGMLSQFTDPEHNRPTLAGSIPIPKVVPAGRLDADSEGLLALTDDGALQARIADPRYKAPKVYWAQVEGAPSEAALAGLCRGVLLRDGPTLPALVREMPEPPGLWPRFPPIRTRLHIPTAWIELTLREGRNRQVRRMTAAVGLPTLRLIRYAIGDWTLDGLAPGEWRDVPVPAPSFGGNSSRGGPPLNNSGSPARAGSKARHPRSR